MTQTESIQVLVVDDHEMVRRGLATFLNSFDDLEMIGEAANGKEALEFCRKLQPDVILLDILMPEMGGIEATRLILEEFPEIKIIAMTSFEEEKVVTEVIRNGAIGFLMKNASIDELADAIRNANMGKPALSPEAAQILMTAATRPPDPSYDLTDRELDVLAQMVDGRTNPQIAELLSISRSTVKTHVSNILGKLNVGSRVEAVKLALENKLNISSPPDD
jgi:NarL family two-component system response regulator LiaR